MTRHFGTSSGARAAAAALVALGALSSCNENLPSGPSTFAASLSIVARDTIVIGDTSVARAVATDAQGHQIEALSFTWTSTDSATVGLAPVSSSPPDTSQGREETLSARRPGRTTVSVSLSDPRFTTSGGSRSETGVVGGVRVTTTHDSTLTAVNDTGVAVATGLIHAANGALTPVAGLGVRWDHRGQHTTVAVTGDTVRYVARSNGVDTLIVTHDFCLAGARCADTVVTRVAQALSLALSDKLFQAWSFGDTLGPTVTLSDRRGNGLAGASIRLVPATAADSAIVRTTAAVGGTNVTTGAIASPQLVSAGNGSAKVYILGIGPDGFSVLAKDSITETVRQVARRVVAEALRPVMTANDSIPVRAVARDARGALIADATTTLTASGVPLGALWAGPTTIATSPVVATITPDVTGVALPSNNPGAPQVAVLVNASQLTLIKPDTVVAGATARTVSVVVLDSIGTPAAGRFVRFGVSFGPTPDSAQADANGLTSALWIPPDSAASYTLTGVAGASTALTTLADSTGRIVLRHSIVVVPDVPSATKSTLVMSATTIAANGTATVTVTVKDRFGNVVKKATPADFTLTAGGAGGTFSAAACVNGVCTATYTAPAAPGNVTISAKILGAEIVFSPIAVTVN